MIFASQTHLFLVVVGQHHAGRGYHAHPPHLSIAVRETQRVAEAGLQVSGAFPTRWSTSLAKMLSGSRANAGGKNLNVDHHLL